LDAHGPLGADKLYGLATGLAEALTAIHAAGVVHRDLKPSNVILAEGGPKVIDFGIAQALDSTAVTKTGMTVGSAGFMAPEQIMGQAGPAADIFGVRLLVEVPGLLLTASGPVVSGGCGRMGTVWCAASGLGTVSGRGLVSRPGQLVSHADAAGLARWRPVAPRSRRRPWRSRRSGS
jgi:serine/threonine protein kinase